MTTKSIILAGLVLGEAASGATIISDNFESGNVSNGWTVNQNATVTAGGPTGSTNYAAIGPSDPVTSGTNWGALGMVFPDGGVPSMTIDVDFRLKGTSRQFNLNVSTSSLTPNGNDAAINLIYSGSSWQVHDGTNFIALSGLMTVSANSWYHMTLETVGWGSNGATYNITVSDGVNTKTVTGLTMRQTGSINTSTVRSFVFNSRYGSNPGFDIDNLVVTGTVIPEPSALFLTLAAAPLFMRRSRTNRIF